jgi:hypothetical protein
MGLIQVDMVRKVLVLLLSFGLLVSNVLAQEKPDSTGWEKDAAYNKLYNVSELDDFKGVVDEVVVVTPMPGMAPGVGLRVVDQDKEMVEVHLGPKSFVKVDGLGLRKGDRVKVKGVWATLDGKDVFLASKVKKGDDFEIKMRRTKDGTPFWTLTPEELSKEKQE